MAIAQPLMRYRCLLAGSSDERLQMFSDPLSKASYEVMTAKTVKEAIDLTFEKLPHFAIIESRLPEGGVLSYFDEMQGKDFFCRIPIIVNLRSEDRGSTSILSSRMFAGFIVDDPQPKTMMLKIRDILRLKLRGSPYLIDLEKAKIPSAFTARSNIIITGRNKENLVALMDARPSPRLSLEIEPSGPIKRPLELQLASSYSGKNSWINFFAVLNQDKETTEWFKTLPESNLGQNGKKVDVVPPKPRRILFCSADTSKYSAVTSRLKASAMQVTFAANPLEAAGILQGSVRFGGVYVSELLSARDKDAFLSVFNSVPVDDQPLLIVGMTGNLPPSTTNVRFVKRPFKLEELADWLEEALTKASDKITGTFQLLGTLQKIQVHAQLPGKICALDEMGGISEQPFIPWPNSEAVLRSPLLTKLFGFRSSYIVRKTEISPDRASYWQSRFSIVQAKKLSEAEFFAQISSTLGRSVKRQQEIELAQSKLKLPYDVSVMNIFIQATHEVIEYYTNDLPKMQKPILKQSNEITQDFITGLTTIEGATIHGSTAIICDRSFIELLATRVSGLSKKQVQQDQSLLGGVMSELCDQIFGKARLVLEAMGYLYNVSLPKVILGGNKESIRHAGNNPVMCIPFLMKSTRFSLEVCFDRHSEAA